MPVRSKTRAVESSHLNRSIVTRDIGSGSANVANLRSARPPASNNTRLWKESPLPNPPSSVHAS